VKDYAGANHPPVVKVAGERVRAVQAGKGVDVDASGSSDPDGDGLGFEWVVYPEETGYAGPEVFIEDAGEGKARVRVPAGARGEVHVIVVVTDGGEPAMTRYRRLVLRVSM
jgi:hypothetical protein